MVTPIISFYANSSLLFPDSPPGDGLTCGQAATPARDAVGRMTGSASSPSDATPHADALEPSQLGDRELAVLESTLRVQLQVSKCVRVAQLTGAVGAYALSGPLSAIPSGVSIVTSQVQRHKLKRHHRKVVREMETRGLHALIGAKDAVRLGKRAYAISVATGLACCMLAFSADVLIDRAVVQVVSEVAMGYVDELAMGSLTGHPQPENHQPLQSKTRSWGGFTSKWKAARAPKRAESLPPDLFGERDENGPQEPRAPSPVAQHIDVQRSSEFAPFGECLVLRFPTIVPGDELELDESLPRVSVVFDGEESDALSQNQWRSLWTLEDGPIDVLDVNEDEDDYDLFGTDDGGYDLFGEGKLRDETTQIHDYDLFGNRAGQECHHDQAFDLFGAHEQSQKARG